MNMFSKRALLKWLLIVLPLVVLALGLAGAGWLLKTNAGANWVWSQVESAASGSLSSVKVEGDLSSGFVIHDMKYLSPELDILTGRALLQVEPGFFPLSVQVRNLQLQDVLVIAQESDVQTQDETANTDFGAAIAALKLPLPVVIQHAEVSNVAYGGKDDSAVVIVGSLTFKLSLDDQLRIDSAVYTSPGVMALAHGSLNLYAPYELVLSLDGELKSADIHKVLNYNIPLAMEFSGDLNELRFRLLSDLLDLQLDGNLLDPGGEPIWDVTGTAIGTQQTLLIADEEIALAGVSLNSVGSIENWSLDISSDIGIAGVPPLALVLSTHGSDTGIQINRSSLSGSGFDVGFNGQLDWSPQPAADISVVIGQMDLSRWVAEWPETAPLTGELGVTWSKDGLKIPQSKLTLSGTNTEVVIVADIDLERNRVFADLGWSDLRWPLQSETPDFSSSTGQMNLSGTVEDWQSDGQILVKLGKYPEGVLDIKGSGGRSFAELQLLDGRVLGGSLKGKVKADWQDSLNWSMDLSALAIDPEPLLADWPGKLDLDFSIEANSADEQLNIKLKSLNGVLRGTGLSGQGGLTMNRSDINFNQLVLETDNATLLLNGDASTKTGVTGEFKGDLPALLLQGASGNVEMEAAFSSHADYPRLELQAQALDLAWSGVSIKALELGTGENDANSLLPAFDLNATGLSWEGETINELSLSLNTENRTSTVQASMTSDLLDMNTVITLTPDEPDDIFHTTWQGALAVLDLAVSKKYRFGLLEPAALSLSATEISLQPACLEETKGAGLCVSAHHRQDSKLAIKADINSLPVDYLREIFEFDFKFEQKLEGQIEWLHSTGKNPSGGADLRITAGRVLDLEENQVLLESNEGVIKFDLQNGNLESGTVDVVFPDVGFIDIDFEVLDIVDVEARALKGRVLSRLNDIGFLGQMLLPGVDEVSGQFDSSISLEGSPADPDFDGGFTLTDGFFHYLPLGLKLEDVGFSGRVNKRDQGSLKGQFKAGDGIGSIDGRFAFADLDNLNMNLSFSGDKLLLVNTGSLSILTETRLELGLSPERVDINGEIKVPKARLTPANLLLGTVSDSEDLVIETRGEKELTTNQELVPGREFFGHLEVSFGGDVYVKVPGVETNISGKVMYDWSGAPIPVADGVYTLKGTVDVYGPTLNIRNGSISFPSVPANNPLLNIRAQRDVYGNTQIRSAGVQVIGTLQRPVLEAYTVPVTNEDRAWTLLVTGSDFEQGQGVGGFDIGTYIMPRLYVSYGISLFEDENVISARYDLKKGFGIKVTSGQRETGLDMSYTIDK